MLHVQTLLEVSPGHQDLCCEFEVCWKRASARALLAAAPEDNAASAPMQELEEPATPAAFVPKDQGTRD